MKIVTKTSRHLVTRSVCSPAAIYQSSELKRRRYLTTKRRNVFDLKHMALRESHQIWHRLKKKTSAITFTMQCSWINVKYYLLFAQWNSCIQFSQIEVKSCGKSVLKSNQGKFLIRHHIRFPLVCCVTKWIKYKKKKEKKETRGYFCFALLLLQFIQSHYWLLMSYWERTITERSHMLLYVSIRALHVQKWTNTCSGYSSIEKQNERRVEQLPRLPGGFCFHLFLYHGYQC